ncbi:dynein axonemal intermediate chain 2-like [Pectinophora gossypiella]|uniref:dynein axonemal intermediate chain 2-like n=1 Tax=Pectinophora gossypiella TaxID=13191 RepID=UPI00214F5680|nr:dynein axonemal intermediate chain 2-like [Pectinophora gossypiella]
MEISVQYTKKRFNFGRQPQFCEQGPDLCDSISTNVLEHKNYILRNPVHQPTQNTPSFSEHSINTVRAEFVCTGANHSEGGWAKDINIHDPEATQRYRRKVEKDDTYIHCVNTLAPGMEHLILQNNAIDMYRTYYSEMEKMPEVEKNSCRTVNFYHDPFGRPVSSICWHPKEVLKFAACYVDVDFYRVAKQAATYAFLWDVESANAPDGVFQPTGTLFDFKFNPRDSNCLIGGLETGQVTVFDRRSGVAPVSTCPMHVAHRDLVRKVLFIHSKSGQEFFSGSPDGCCKWWDLRKLSETTDEMIIDLVKSNADEQSMATACGVSSMEYESTIPTRFMVGTDNGMVIGGNRKGKTATEKLPVTYNAHSGPVMSVERNPAFPKCFLTVGDWTVRVWSEECRESSILWSPPLRYGYSSGAWSPSRISMMLMSGTDGRLAIWDLLRRQHEPVFTMQISSNALLTQQFHESGSLVAIGNRSGDICLVEMSRQLAESDKNDKLLLQAIIDRETKRERILEARAREIRVKQKQADEASPAASITDLEQTIGDHDLNEATTDYMQILKKELASM